MPKSAFISMGYIKSHNPLDKGNNLCWCGDMWMKQAILKNELKSHIYLLSFFNFCEQIYVVENR
ncbi:MAG: hypothetical protein E7021_05250 [Alphaproteobacteria bacterium]|nr:hypothetical protein [Alphaproteobacteria bacterium]